MILNLSFIALVYLDGFLTQKLLALGATELNPFPGILWTVEHLWARVLIAIAIVILIRFFQDDKLLFPLTFVCLGICIYNGLNLATTHAALYAVTLIGPP